MSTTHGSLPNIAAGHNPDKLTPEKVGRGYMLIHDYRERPVDFAQFLGARGEWKGRSIPPTPYLDEMTYRVPIESYLNSRGVLLNLAPVAGVAGMAAPTTLPERQPAANGLLEALVEGLQKAEKSISRLEAELKAADERIATLARVQEAMFPKLIADINDCVRRY